MAIDVDTVDQRAVGAFAERVMGDCVGGLTTQHRLAGPAAQAGLAARRKVLEVPPAHALYELRP
jgi:hypothetical protein